MTAQTAGSPVLQRFRCPPPVSTCGQQKALASHDQGLPNRHTPPAAPEGAHRLMPTMVPQTPDRSASPRRWSESAPSQYRQNKVVR